MRNHFSKLAFKVALAFALAFIFGCTSSIEMPPQPDNSSSSAGETGQSSSGNLSSSSSAMSSSSLPSSSSSWQSSSSSSLPPDMVFCLYGGGCVPLLAESCSAIGGQEVPGCPASSSSSSPSNSSSSSLQSSSSSQRSSSSSATQSSSGLAPSSSSVGAESCDGFVDGTEREHYGKSKPQFCDERDGKKYVYVTIVSSSSTQTWMAENLNYAADGSKCYGDNTGGDSQNNCATYGRLYNYAMATTVCPSGWHLSTKDELAAIYKNESDRAKLKTKGNYWCNGNQYDDTNCNNGTDIYGFSALPGGFKRSSFDGIKTSGFWWSSTNFNVNQAYGMRIEVYHFNASSPIEAFDKEDFYSVRCVKD